MKRRCTVVRWKHMHVTTAQDTRRTRSEDGLIKETSKAQQSRRRAWSTVALKGLTGEPLPSTTLLMMNTRQGPRTLATQRCVHLLEAHRCGRMRRMRRLQERTPLRESTRACDLVRARPVPLALRRHRRRPPTVSHRPATPQKVAVALLLAARVGPHHRASALHWHEEGVRLSPAPARLRVLPSLPHLLPRRPYLPISRRVVRLHPQL